MPSRRHSSTERQQRGLFTILIRYSRHDTRRWPRHGIVHSSTNTIRLGRCGSGVTNGCRSTVQSPIGCRRFRFPFVFVFRRGEFETYSKEGPRVDFSLRGKLSPGPGPSVRIRTLLLLLLRILFALSRDEIENRRAGIRAVGGGAAVGVAPGRLWYSRHRCSCSHKVPFHSAALFRSSKAVL
jgi:hypothetical protein